MSPVDLLKVSPKERRLIEAGETADTPKYTSSSLTNAVRWSRANSPEVLGNINEIFDEFQDQHPDGQYQEWQEFYYRKHDGAERIEEGTVKAYDMLQNIREAIAQLDREDVRNFLEELVIFQTYRGKNIRNVIIKILDRKYRPEVQRVPTGHDRVYVHATVGEALVSIQPESGEMIGKSVAAIEDDEVAVVYYRENETNAGLRVNVEELNRSLSPFIH